jgi:hypothetical protein
MSARFLPTPRLEMLIYASTPHTVRGVVLKLQKDKVYVLPYYLVSDSDFL